MTSNKVRPLIRLPPEIWRLILEELPCESLFSLIQASNAFEPFVIPSLEKMTSLSLLGIRMDQLEKILPKMPSLSEILDLPESPPRSLLDLLLQYAPNLTIIGRRASKVDCAWYCDRSFYSFVLDYARAVKKSTKKKCQLKCVKFNDSVIDDGPHKRSMVHTTDKDIKKLLVSLTKHAPNFRVDWTLTCPPNLRYKNFDVVKKEVLGKVRHLGFLRSVTTPMKWSKFTALEEVTLHRVDHEIVDRVLRNVSQRLTKLNLINFNESNLDLGAYSMPSLTSLKWTGEGGGQFGVSLGFERMLRPSLRELVVIGTKRFARGLDPVFKAMTDARLTNLDRLELTNFGVDFLYYNRRLKYEDRNGKVVTEEPFEVRIGIYNDSILPLLKYFKWAKKFVIRTRDPGQNVEITRPIWKNELKLSHTSYEYTLSVLYRK